MNSYNCQLSRRDDLSDELQVILKQQSTKYSNKFDYLFFEDEEEHQQPAQNNRVNEAHRKKICKWLFEVIDYFRCDRGVVFIALDYIDRFSAVKTQKRRKAMEKQEFQLITLASLYLAIKLHGQIRDTDSLKIQYFVKLSRGKFSVQDLEAKEREILTVLDWHLNPPSVAKILPILICMLCRCCEVETELPAPSGISEIFDEARFMIELTAIEIPRIFFNHDASEIAFASILCAICVLQNKLQLPDAVCTKFIDDVTESADLVPDSVSSICAALNDLRVETMLEDENSETYPINGRTSPVSVITEY